MKNQFVWLNAKIEHSSSYFQFVSDKSKDTLTQTNEGTITKIIFIGRVKFEWLNGIYTAYKHFITSTEIGPETALAMSYGEERICWKLCDRFLQKANAKGKNAVCYVFCYNKPLKRKENKNYVWEVCQQMFSLVFFLSLFSFPSYSLYLSRSIHLSTSPRACWKIFVEFRAGISHDDDQSIQIYQKIKTKNTKWQQKSTAEQNKIWSQCVVICIVFMYCIGIELNSNWIEIERIQVVKMSLLYKFLGWKWNRSIRHEADGVWECLSWNVLVNN